MATIDEAEIERQFLNEQRGGSTEGGVARGDSAWLLSQTSTVTDSRSEDVHLFKKTHMNEKLSPELLPYEELVVTNLKRFLEAQVSIALPTQSSLRLCVHVIGDVEADNRRLSRNG